MGGGEPARNGLWGPPCLGNTTKPDRSTVRPGPSSPSAAAAGCDPNYAGACVPVYPPDVDCGDICAPVRVVGRDPHRLDGDGDGLACQSYG